MEWTQIDTVHSLMRSGDKLWQRKGLLQASWAHVGAWHGGTDTRVCLHFSLACL